MDRNAVTGILNLTVWIPLSIQRLYRAHHDLELQTFSVVKAEIYSENTAFTA
jgi:hypothetical protein